MKPTLLFAIILALAGLANAKDHSADYKMGVFVSAAAVADGTITNTLHGDGTTVAGDVYSNQVGVYTIRVPEGTWYVSTLAQSQDSMLRGMGMTPTHFKSEKANPLDGLKNGDKVLFRLHERHYLNGKFTLMAIPYADNPNKEVEFSTRFVPDVAPAVPQKATDNVKAMCDAGKLSPELQAQYCSVQPTDSLAANRQDFVSSFNAANRQDFVSRDDTGEHRAEITGDTLTFHSPKCSQTAVNLMLSDARTQEMLSALRLQYVIFTNDSDLTFVYDVGKKQLVDPK